MEINLKKKHFTPYKLIAPALIFMIIVYGYPMVLTFYYSLQKVSLINDNSQFIGLSNYLTVLKDPDFYALLLLTIKWTFLTVVFKVGFGFLFAILLNSKMYLQKSMRFLILIPWAIPQVVVAILWAWILDGDLGYLNYVITSIMPGIEPIRWLSNEGMAFVWTSFVDAWIGIPLVTMIFLSGLSGMSDTLYEAAEVDGASVMQRFLNITLPEMKRIIFITLTLTTIWSFNSFNVIFVLTGGGPMGATQTMMIEIYKTAFGKYNLGMSSTLSVLVFIILTTLSIIYWKQLEKDMK